MISTPKFITILTRKSLDLKLLLFLKYFISKENVFCQNPFSIEYGSGSVMRKYKKKLRSD